MILQKLWVMFILFRIIPLYIPGILAAADGLLIFEGGRLVSELNTH